MTWDEMIKRIMETMSESEREKEVLYREPYDNDAEVFELSIFEAQEDLVDPEGEVKIKKGEFFLQ